MSPILSETRAPHALYKPWSRKKTAAVGCGGAFAALLVVALGYVGWANYLPPPPEPDNIALPNPNGFDAVNAANIQIAAGYSPALAQPLKAKIGPLRKALRPVRPGLKVLRAALRLEYRVPRRSGNEAPASFVMLGPAAQALAAESRVARTDGDIGTALDRALDVVELGAIADRGAGISNCRDGLELCGFGCLAAAPCLSGLDEKTARAAEQRTEKILARAAPYAEMVEEERRYVLAVYRSLACSRRIAESDGAESVWQRWLAYRWLYPKSRTYLLLDGYYRAIQAEIQKPYSQQHGVSFPVEPYLSDFFCDSADIYISRLEEIPTRLRLLCLDLALQAYHRRHGQYPKSLDAVSRGLASAVSVDPFTDRAFVYRRSGPGYFLYSIGSNRRDDGGREPVTGSGDLISPGTAVQSTSKLAAARVRQ